MKKYLIICSALLGVSFLGHAQVGIGLKKPSNSAMLHVYSEGGDRGVILPSVALSDINVFSPINGNPSDPNNIGLLVFNTSINTSKDLTRGYYYWTGSSWTRIVDSQSLKEILDNLPDGGGSGENGNSAIKNYVIYKANEGNFYNVEIDAQGKATETLIDLASAVSDLETKTTMTRREDVNATQMGDYSVYTQEPAPEKGKVIYKYTAEGGKEYFVDFTNDLLASLENNTNVRNEVLNIIGDDNSGNRDAGNVYFGEFPGEQNEVLYRSMIDENGDRVSHIIDIGHNILHFFQNAGDEIHNSIRNYIGYNISLEATSTGNKVEQARIYVYKDFISIEENNAETFVLIPTNLRSKISSVFSISILDTNGNTINVGTTDVAIENTKISFSLGSGSMYTPLPKGEYNAVIEFTQK
ncbi:hypothetical protein ACYSNX_03595 [Myroides sp. LJL115]